MPVTLKDILELPEMSNMKLIAGREGLDRIITRPLVGHIDYASEVFGGELLFITGAGFRADEGTLKSLISESCFKNFAGLAFSVPMESFPVIEENVLLFSDSLSFPLFQIPWDSMLSEIIKAIISRIGEREKEDSVLHTLMEKVITANPDETDGIKKRLTRLGYNCSCPYQAAILKIARPQGAMPDNSKHREYINLFTRNLLKRQCRGSMTMSLRDEIIIFASAGGGRNILPELIGVRDAVITHFPGIHLNIGIGKPSSGIGFLHRSLKEAENALTNRDMPKASSSGMFSLFYDTLDYSRIETFCDKNIGKLIDYDRLNGSELVRTIEVYFENKFNLSRTAVDLMIHRNSLMYRLRRIEEIIGRKLDDPYVLLDIINSVYIKKALSSATRATG